MMARTNTIQLMNVHKQYWATTSQYMSSSSKNIMNSPSPRMMTLYLMQQSSHQLSKSLAELIFMLASQ